MSVIDLILQAEAAANEHAVPRTAYRHRHISVAPLIVCAYNLSGEAAAPIAFTYGTSRADIKTVVAAEPRNRESRFKALNEFSADFHEHLAAYLATESRLVGRPNSQFELEVAVDAPQVVFPNTATQRYVADRLGRSLRYLGLRNSHEVPEATLWTGAHLSWMSDYSHYPGQSVVVAASELLSRHFATGQSALEDENLAALLAWITNPSGGGLKRIRKAERQFPFGPVPDPKWEAELEPLVREYTLALRSEKKKAMRAAERRVLHLVEPVLTDAWEGTHQALEILRSIPSAASVPKRWENDIREWGAYCRRASHGLPRFSRRHSPLLAARRLETWTKAQESLEADEAFDDPLVMAAFDADGQCLFGRAILVDTSNREVKPGRVRESSVPLVTLALDTPTRLLPGTVLVWTADRRVEAEVRSVPPAGSSGEAVLAIMGGHKNCTRLPQGGDEASFVTLNPFQGRSPGEPAQVPWTHRVAAEPLGAVDGTAEVDRSDGDDDGSPDMTPDQLAGLPTIGNPGLDEVPGVVL